MAKARTTAFFCSECGYESSKWMGQCPACKAWNLSLIHIYRDQIKALKERNEEHE